MSVAELGFAIDSSQAVTAKSNLDKMSAAAGAAEQAQQRLSAASSGANAALTRIASGVDQANVMLAKLVAAVEAGNTAQTKFAASALRVETANIATARTAEVATAAMRQSTIATDQATQALERQNAAVMAQAAAARARAASGLDAWGNPANSNQQAASGSSRAPTMGSFQAGAGAVRMFTTGAASTTAFATAIGAILNPAMAVHFALFAIGGAAVEYFRRSRDGADQLGEALKKNKQAVTELADAYKLVGFNIDEVTRKSVLMAEAAERQSRRQTQKELDKSLKSLLGDTSNMSMGFLFPEWMRSSDVTLVFDPFRSAIDGLRKGLAAGHPDFETFQKQVDRIAQTDPGKLRLWADVLLDMQAEAAATAKQLGVLDEFNRNGRTGRLVGPAGMDDRQASGRQIIDQQRHERELKLAMEREQFEAHLEQQRARTNAEKLAAAERIARAGASGAAADLRAERARREELQRQEMERRDAETERHRAQLRSIEAAKEELSLIGATTGETTRLQYQFSEIARLKEEAARKGELVSTAEVERIKQTAAELGKVADAAARLNLARDLQFEREQLFRSPEQQEIAGRLHSAGLPVDFNSVEAGLIRANIQLDRMKSTWESIFETANNGVDTLVDALFDGTSSIEDALKSIGRDFARQMFDLAVTNPFKNWLTGGNLQSIADLGIFGSGASSGQGGGFGGVLGNLLGAQKAVSAMQVQAASVIVNGSVLGGMGGLGGIPGVGGGFSPNTTLSQFLGGSAANDNKSMPMALSGIGSPVGQMAYGNDLASNIKTLAGKIGANPRDLAAVMSFESGFRQNIWGGANNGYYGLIQAGASERANYGITPGGSLSDQFAGIEKFFKARGFKPGMSGMDLYSTVNAGSPGRYNASDAMNGGTWGTVADKWNYQMSPHFAKADALLGPTNKASDALDKLATSSTSTASGLASGLGSLTGVTQSTMQALEQFGIGAGNLGSMLQNLMNTGGGFGGNWFSNLAGMFGGSGGALNYMNSISPAATANILKGGVGLYANGAPFSAGNVIPFANGDVFSSPALFPMSGGKTGMLGEAGPEAIMPLRRGSDGKLGVAAQTGFTAAPGISAGQIESIVGAISKKLSLNVKNVTVLDPSVVGDYLRTDEGEQVVMNIIRQNRAA
ncbi:hypothetical protein [Pseudaminobacter soli (ex Li et al. 2025)]|uniref:Bacteriophage tail tape measure N-terminal domain-containing protein n=1 Tax=Pseudaminobacter soli (ex Li et al. 2025) TaxID=1295366 RepID=A0A2P7SE47_9HYPH|nr:hypothetical protein [Mesorhizobium soli]PSJ60743.1 hypothetical protein C7I85_11920 [Mesorhizobium soli]